MSEWELTPAECPQDVEGNGIFGQLFFSFVFAIVLYRSTKSRRRKLRARWKQARRRERAKSRAKLLQAAPSPGRLSLLCDYLTGRRRVRPIEARSPSRKAGDNGAHQDDVSLMMSSDAYFANGGLFDGEPLVNAESAVSASSDLQNRLRHELSPIARSLAEIFGFQISAVDGSSGSEERVPSNVDAQVDHVMALLAAHMDRTPESTPWRERLQVAVNTLHKCTLYNYDRWLHHTRLHEAGTALSSLNPSSGDDVVCGKLGDLR